MSAISLEQIKTLPALLDQNPTMFAGKKVLLRLDLNIPLTQTREIADDTRLQAALPCIKWLLDAGSQLSLLSHLGKPKGTEAHLSLKALLIWLEENLHRSVVLDTTWPTQPLEAKADQVVLIENVRFLVGETECDEALSQQMAESCDIFVQEAFGCVHRNHASITGIPRFCKQVFAGPLLMQELSTLAKTQAQIEHPFVVVVGGAKLATKLPLLKEVAKRCDTILLGGCLANTFLAAKGYPMGTSRFEADFVEEAKALLSQYPNRFVLPVDVISGTGITDTTPSIHAADALAQDRAILDIGPESQALFANHIRKAKLVLWNGPMGAFEHTPFAKGTQSMAQAIASCKGYTLLGGGETLAAFGTFANKKDVSYACTGGGAFLAFFQPDGLPGVSALLPTRSFYG